MQDNPSYQFISDNVKAASRIFGVKSISLVAIRRRSGSRLVDPSH